MSNLVGPDIHDDQEDQLLHAFTAEREPQEAQTSPLQKILNSAAYKFYILPKEESLAPAQKTLQPDVQEALKVSPAFLFCASPQPKPAETNEEDVTETFIEEFNAHRGNQEKLSQAKKMIHKTRSLAGLESHSVFVDIPSARRNFFLLAQLDHQELKMAALENLILVLQMDQVSKQTAFDLLDLAIDLMKQMDRQLIQTQLIDQQIRICQAYGMVAELIQWHYGKKHIGGVTTELKKQLLLTLDTLKDLNTHEDPALSFAVSYALEGFKRLKDDRKELFELGERALYFLAGVIGAYKNGNYDFMGDLKKAFQGIDIRIKQSWYDSSSVFNSLVRFAYSNPNQLLAVQTMLNESWHDLSWKFTYNALQKLAEIAIHGSTPEIRSAAFKGQHYSNEKLPGILNFMDCKAFRITTSRKPLVHLKPPVHKDNNVPIRFIVLQQLIRICQECPDQEIRKEAKKMVLRAEKTEASSTVLGSFSDFIPQGYEERQNWLKEEGPYQWKSENKEQKKPESGNSSIPQLASNILGNNTSKRTPLPVLNFKGNEAVPPMSTPPINIKTSNDRQKKSLKTSNSPEKKVSKSHPNSPRSNPSTLNLNSSYPNLNSTSQKKKTSSQVKERKLKRLSQPVNEIMSKQAVMMSQCLNMDPEVINRYIEFNQEIHLADNGTLFISKIGMQKIISLIEQLNESVTLDFRQCKIEPEGLVLLAQSLPELQVSTLHMPRGLDRSVGLILAHLFKSELHFTIELDSPEDDLQLGILLTESGFVTDGIKYFQMALGKLADEQNDTLKADIYFHLGEALLIKEENKKAEQNLLKAFNLVSWNKKVNTSLARFYFMRENYPEAAKYAQNALSAPHDDTIEVDNKELLAILNKQIGKNV